MDRGRNTIPPPVQSALCYRLPTLSYITHATPHSTFSQLEHVEASSSPASYTISMAENIASTGYPLLTYILNLKWTYKIHALLLYRLITATFIIQILYSLYSLALLLSLSLIRKRLYSYRTLVIALILTNHSLYSLGTHMTFSQTLSFYQTLLYSLLLLSSSQTLKQTPLKSSLKGLITTISVPLRLYIISGSRFKQLSFSVYLI